MSYLSFDDLLVCRLVSGRWGDLVTKCFFGNPLSLRALAHVKFSFKPSFKCYKSKAIKTRGETLEDFMKILKMSEATGRIHPFQSFHFKRGDLVGGGAGAFFTNNGHEIKNLTLSLYDLENSTNLQILRRVLLVQAPYIQMLTLHEMRESWDDGDEANEAKLFPGQEEGNIELPHLTSLDFGEHIRRKIFSDIVRAAPQLKTFQGFYDIRYFDPSAPPQLNKIWTVKYLGFNPTPENIELFQLFVAHSDMLKLEKIWFCLDLKYSKTPEFIQKSGRILEKLIKSSSNSLTKLDFVAPLGVFSTPIRIQIPTGPRVTHVSFDFFENWSNWAGWNLSQFYPNLHTILFYDLKEQNFNSAPAPSVKTLDLRSSASVVPLVMKKLAGIFPQVENLDLEIESRNWEGVMRVLWRDFRQLKLLKMAVDLVDDEFSVSSMDSAITGFATETCEELENSSRRVSVQDAEDLREHPSIFDAKGDHALHIIVMSRSILFTQYEEPLAKLN
jgi:hypothetical protein